MLATERRNYILERIRESGGVQVEKMAAELGVSLMTIRRDLRVLNESGMVERCRGGAVVREEEPYLQKATEREKEKAAIAKKALSYVKDGDVVFLDAGTTTYQLLKLLNKKHNITVVTNDLVIAYYANVAKMEVIICGGRVQNETSCMIGLMTNEMLKGLKLDIAFIGTASIDEYFDVLTPTESKALYKRTAIRNSGSSYLLVDKSKFHKKAIIRINNLRDYTGVITDCGFNKEEERIIEENNIHIIQV